MYKIVYLRCILEINGIAKKLFGREKEISIIRYNERKPILVVEENVDDTIENYNSDIRTKIMKDFENGYRFFCESTERIVTFKQINSIKQKNGNYVTEIVDVDSVSYEELRKIANVRELMEIEEYYKNLI